MYTPSHCPSCHSPAPHRHPAVQFEGEVSICPDVWHGQPTNATRGNADPWRQLPANPAYVVLEDSWDANGTRRIHKVRLLGAGVGGGEGG